MDHRSRWISCPSHRERDKTEHRSAGAISKKIKVHSSRRPMQGRTESMPRTSLSLTGSLARRIFRENGADSYKPLKFPFSPECKNEPTQSICKRRNKIPDQR